MLTQSQCPSCAAPVGYLPGTLAVRCSACGTVVHVTGAESPTSAPRGTPTRSQEVHLHLTAAGTGHGASGPATDSVESARFKYERLRDKLEDLKKRKTEARTVFRNYYKNEIRIGQLSILLALGVAVAWALGEPWAADGVAPTAGLAAFFWAYVVVFGQRKIRAVQKSIETTEAEIERFQSSS